MLEFENESGRLRLADAITRLQCEIKLPESWDEFFKVSGLAESSVADGRHAARWQNRVLAGLLYRTTLPALPRSEGWHPIYVKDLSRSGAAFVHNEQMFPLERMSILMIDDCSSRLLRNDCLRTVAVVWCKRVQYKCF